MIRTQGSRVREQEFLLCCAAAEHRLVSCLQLQEYADCELDWKYVFEITELHGLLPQLKARMEKFCPDALPAHASDELDRACRANAARNLALTGELLSILQVMETYGIEVVPFKGPALAERIFGSVAMRQFCDLDIMVRPDWVIRAREVLLARGYVPEFELSPAREAEYIRAEHAFQLRHPAKDCIVELHWSFGSKDQSFPLAAGEVWQRLCRARLQSRHVNALSDEDLFLYLCMHGAKHRWERLEWICSLAELAAKHSEMNWDALRHRSEVTGAMRGFHLGLLLIEQVCGVVLPRRIAERARTDAKAQALASDVQASFFAEEPVHATREFRRQLFYLRSRERLVDRARIVWFSCARIPHPLARDWDLFHLPTRMAFLYYFLRPLRLFRDFGMRMLQERRSYEYR